MFFEHGFDAVPMSKVAKAAGVTTPALYWHFKSKADLYFEVVDKAYRESFDRLVKHAVGNDAREKMRSYVRYYVEEQLRDRDATLMFGIGQHGARIPERKKEEFDALQRMFNELLRGVLQDGQEAGEFNIKDVSVTTYAIQTMCEYSATWFKPGGRLSAAEVAELYADLANRMTALSSGDE